MKEMTVYMVSQGDDGNPEIVEYVVVKRRSSRWSSTSYYYDVQEAPKDAYYEEGDAIGTDEVGVSKKDAIVRYKRQRRVKMNEWMGYIKSEIEKIKWVDQLTTGE